MSYFSCNIIFIIKLIIKISVNDRWILIGLCMGNEQSNFIIIVVVKKIVMALKQGVSHR